jgi:hypothetical protein
VVWKVRTTEYLVDKVEIAGPKKLLTCSVSFISDVVGKRTGIRQRRRWIPRCWLNPDLICCKFVPSWWIGLPCGVMVPMCPEVGNGRRRTEGGKEKED